MTSSSAIRTPDQRLRVFVSSTLQELAAERVVARAAVEKLHLTPVMFELGARAHPPRDLYRAYLAQSDVFIGIYWGRYGWVAPGMDVSGLEDEYLLSAGMPRLIYIKKSDQREPRLVELLERIKNEDLSFRPFADPHELEALIANDVALMLTERFAEAQARAKEAPAPAPVVEAPPLFLPPAEHGALLGRDALIQEIAATLERPDVPLVTLTGPGGIGKTSLAIHLAHSVAARFSGGVFYVPLAATRDAADVMQAIASTLGVPLPQGGSEPLALVSNYLRPRQALLVLDNFEQVVDAGRDVAQLLATCRQLKVLVTSRTPLRIRGERELPVPQLAVAPEGRGLPAALALFEARAQAVRPSFQLNDENYAAVAEICRRVDGLPLAIELAAARIRVLTPQAILPRLDKSLSLLTGGAKDLPERQQTLRGALAWSHDLLTDDERVLFRRLGAFHGGFSFEAAESLAPDLDVLELLTSLVDKSLVVRGEALGDPRFHLLETVREFALEQLVAAGQEDATRERLVDWAERFVRELEPTISNASARRTHERFALEDPHVRAVLTWCVAHDLQRAWRLFVGYGWLLQNRMRMRDTIHWFERIKAAGACADEHVFLRARTLRGSAAASSNDGAAAVEHLTAAAEGLAARADLFWAAITNATRGMTLMMAGDPSAVGIVELCLEQMAAHVKAGGRGESVGFPMVLLAWADLAAGNLTGARARANEVIDRMRAEGDVDNLASGIAMLARVEIAEDNLSRARELLGNGVAVTRDTGAVYGRLDALMMLCMCALAEGDDAQAQALCEETMVFARGLGTGTGIELILGTIASLLVKRGELDRAATIVQAIPDGYEDSEEIFVVALDPLGTMRAALKSARAALGARGKATTNVESAYDAAVDAAIARPAK